MIEQQLQRSLFSQQSEKTYIDKILSRQDVDTIRELVKKPELSRAEILDLLYLISGAEAKLLNYGEWDRYVVLKFYVWIRDFVSVAEQLYDYVDWLAEQEKQNIIVLTPEGSKMIKNNKRLIEHMIKFLADLYLNIGRTSLSIGATGFMEILKNKYEIAYPNMPQAYQPEERKTSFFKRGGK